MQYVMAVPVRIGESPPNDAGIRRLSIQADAANVDLVLPAAVPIGSLIPPIVDVLASRTDFTTRPVAVRYQLSVPGAAALDSSKTLTQAGIRDGAVLLLTSSSTPLMAPRFDDAAEAVSASVASLEQRWTRRRSRVAGMLAAMWLAGVSAAAICRNAFNTNDTARSGDAYVATAIGLLTLVAAAIAYLFFRDRCTGLAMGLVATAFAALAGLVAVPGELGAPNMLFAVAAAAAMAAIMLVISGQSMVFATLVTLATTGAAAALVDAITAMPPQAVGAAFAAVSLSAVEASTPVSIMLGRLSPSTAEPGSDAPPTSPDQLTPRVINADRKSVV